MRTLNKKQGDHMVLIVAHTIIKRIMLFMSIIVLGGIVGVYLLEAAIEELQHNIEERALPVLRIDVEEIRDTFLKIFPHPKKILACIPFCSAIGGAVVDAVKKPLIKKALKKTIDDLNQELSFIKIKRLSYEEEEKRRTITAYCSYDVTVILTGETFNDIIETRRDGLTLSFICN
jgi:hypothetical protein